MHNRRPPPSTEQPILNIDPHILDFGEALDTDEFVITLTVRNTSAVPVRLAEWQSSCNCLGVEPSSLEFGPHEAKSVTVRIDLASKLPPNSTTAQTAAVNFSGVLGDGKTVSWQVRGRVRPLVKARPDLVFPSLSELAQPFGTRPVVLEFTEPVSIESLGSDSPFVVASLGAAAGSPQTRHPIELQFSAAIPAGEYPFALNVRAAHQTTRQQIVKRFGGLLCVVADVQSDPGQIVFPARAVGEANEETVILKSLTGRSISIESVTTEGDGLTAERIEGEPKLLVRQRGVTAGQTIDHPRAGRRALG